MLTMEQRLVLAEHLQHLRKRLQERPELALRDLPKDLQQTIREQKVLGSITSSGLEYVTTIIDRIDWAIYYLSEPSFPANQKVAAEAEPQPEATKPAERKNDHRDVHSLDFGPFDPTRTANG